MADPDDTAYSTRWDPQYLALMQRQREEAPPVNRYSLPFAQARELLVQERRRSRSDTPAMQAITDERIELPGRTVSLRYFQPAGAMPGALMLYLHGGGWCVGSNETHETILRHLAQASGMTVCGMEYALAPEAPFPTATQEVAAVTDLLLARLPPASGPRLVLAGDSAGANLALVEAMRRRNADASQLAAQIAGLVLFYGVFGPSMNMGSHLAYGSGAFGLSLAAQDRYLGTYLDGASPDWRVFPLMGSLAGLPPIHLQAAELDLLRDDSLDLHQAVLQARGRSALRVRTGVPHGYLSNANLFAGARDDLVAAGGFALGCLGGREAGQA